MFTISLQILTKLNTHALPLFEVCVKFKSTMFGYYNLTFLNDNFTVGGRTMEEDVGLIRDILGYILFLSLQTK